MSAPSRLPLLRALVVAVLAVAVPIGTALAVRARPDRPSAELPAVVGLPPALGADAVDGCAARGEGGPDVGGAAGLELPEGVRVTSAAVLACPVGFDGLEVLYAGEVVGDVLRRDGGAWVQVNDDAYALGRGPLGAHGRAAGVNSGLAVWLPDALVDRVRSPGRPDRRGDVVLLRARVVRVDPTDGGGLTLRASDLTVLAPTAPVDRPFDRTQAFLAVGWLAIGLAVADLRARAARRDRA